MTRLLDRIRPPRHDDSDEGRATPAEEDGPVHAHDPEALALFVDPRFAARRDATVADARNGRRRRAATFALGLTVAAGAIGAARSPLLSVHTIRLSGAAETQESAVIDASDLLDAAMVSLDGASAARRIAALPWVLTASVRRSWPNTVVVAVTERAPVAVVPAGAVTCALAPCLALVDVTGRVLGSSQALTPATAAGRRPPTASQGSGVAGSFVHIVGVGDAPPPGTRLAPSALEAVLVAAGLPEALRPLVAQVEVDSAGEVGIRLSGQGKAPGALVRLGTADRMATKLTAAATVLDRVPRGGLAVVDVRVPEAPVLTRSPATTTVSPSSRG